MTAPDEATTRIDQIAEAALRRFARYGFKRSSMDDIAREAGLAKATLYLHFKGKDDVFRAMLALIGRRVEARCAAVMATSSPFPDRLAALLDAHYGTGYACFGSGEHLVELKTVMVSIAGAEVEAFEAIFARHVTALIEAAEAQGAISFARSGLSKPAFVATLMRAAGGAKPATGLSHALYETRLRDIAAVFAAALTD
jgi:AcrR family transcriptional regulator